MGKTYQAMSLPSFEEFKRSINNSLKEPKKTFGNGSALISEVVKVNLETERVKFNGKENPSGKRKPRKRCQKKFPSETKVPEDVVEGNEVSCKPIPRSNKRSKFIFVSSTRKLKRSKKNKENKVKERVKKSPKIIEAPVVSEDFMTTGKEWAIIKSRNRRFTEVEDPNLWPRRSLKPRQKKVVIPIKGNNSGSKKFQRRNTRRKSYRGKANKFPEFRFIRWVLWFRKNFQQNSLGLSRKRRTGFSSKIYIENHPKSLRISNKTMGGFSSKVDSDVNENVPDFEFSEVGHFFEIINKVYEPAFKSKRKQLRNEINPFFAKYASALIRGKGFLKIRLEILNYLLGSKGLVVNSELELFLAIVRWAEHQLEVKQVYKSGKNLQKIMKSPLKFLDCTGIKEEDVGMHIWVFSTEQQKLFERFPRNKFQRVYAQRRDIPTLTRCDLQQCIKRLLSLEPMLRNVGIQKNQPEELADVVKEPCSCTQFSEMAVGEITSISFPNLIHESSHKQLPQQELSRQKSLHHEPHQQEYRKEPSHQQSQSTDSKRSPRDTVVNLLNGNHQTQPCSVNWNLKSEILEGLAALGFNSPPSLYSQMLIALQQGNDLVVEPPVGSEEIVAILAVLLQNLNIKDGSTQALILAPTQILATAVLSVLEHLGCSLGMTSLACVGGTNVREMMRELHNGRHIVVGTAGRVLNMLNRKCWPIQSVDVIVFLETDTFLGRSSKRSNFGTQIITKIMKQLKVGVKLVLLQATYSSEAVTEFLRADWSTEASENSGSSRP